MIYMYILDKKLSNIYKIKNNIPIFFIYYYTILFKRYI